MDRESQIEKLTQTLGVDAQSAARALDAAGGDLLDAALALEGERPAQDRRVAVYSTARPQPEPPPAAQRPPVGDDVLLLLRGLVTHPVTNTLRVSYAGRLITAVPAVILVLLPLVAFWTTLCLLALGVLLGCSFTLDGPQWSIESFNSALEALRLRVSQWRTKLLKGR